MADLTYGTIVIKSDTVVGRYQAGDAAIAIGWCYNAGSSLYKNADADAGVTESAASVFAITTCAADGYFVGVTGGGIAFGATLVVGTEYVLSGTAGGKTAPSTDLATGDYVTKFGVADASDNLPLNISATGVQVP